MATTNEDLCNIALSRIGVSSNPISDLTTDASTEADMCNLHLTLVIKRIMRQHDWPFTKAYIQPTLVVAAFALLPREYQPGEALFVTGRMYPFEFKARSSAAA